MMSVNILGKTYDLKTTIKLDLSSTGLTELPKELGNLINLQNLYCYSNQLKELRKELGNLINLQKLYLQSCQMIYSV